MQNRTASGGMFSLVVAFLAITLGALAAPTDEPRLAPQILDIGKVLRERYGLDCQGQTFDTANGDLALKTHCNSSPPLHLMVFDTVRDERIISARGEASNIWGEVVRFVGSQLLLANDNDQLWLMTRSGDKFRDLRPGQKKPYQIYFRSADVSANQETVAAMFVQVAHIGGKPDLSDRAHRFVFLRSPYSGEIRECAFPFLRSRYDIFGLALSGNGRKAAIVANRSSPPNVWIVSLEDCTVEQSFAYPGAPSHVEISQDGRWVAAGSPIVPSKSNAMIVLWDLTTGRMAGRLESRGGVRGQFVFSPDGELLVVDTSVFRLYWYKEGGRVVEPGIAVWSVPTRKLLKKISLEEELVNSELGSPRSGIRFSRDGRKIMVLSRSLKLYHYDVAQLKNPAFNK